MNEERKKWAVRATLTEVIMCILLLLSGVPALVQITRIYQWIFSVLFILLLAACHTDLTGLAVQSAKEGKSLDLDKWDKLAKDLEERLGKPSYWLGWSSAVALVSTMVYVGFPFLAVAFSTKVLLTEAIMHRLEKYMNDEKNKTRLGAASYMYEVKQTLEEIAKEDKMKGFYKDI
jgi:hypothetical protein